MRKIPLKIKRLVLIGGDIAVLYLSLYIVLTLRYSDGFTTEIWNAHALPFSISFIIWIAIFYITGFYSQHAVSKDNYAFFQTVIKALIFALATTMAMFYFIPAFGIAPKTNLLLMGVVFLMLFLLWRYLYNFLIRSSKLLHTIIFIGMNKEMRSVISLISRTPHLGFNIAGFVDSPNLHSLKELIKKHDADTVVYTENNFPADTQNSTVDLSKILYSLIPLKIAIIDLPTFYAHVTEKIPVSIIGETWFLENLIESEKNAYEIEKRLFDFIFALLGGILFLPFLPLIAILIIIDSRGPVFYSQNRVGKNGNNFKLVKFRTMVQHAEQKGIQWTKARDSRVTLTGKFLRKTRIDELPQLWNVLKGDMSFVGPRPERPEFVQTLEKEIPHYHMRHLVKPGLTGWAQINQPLGGASVEDSIEKLQYDLYYIKHRSLIIDLDIIAKTIPIILKREGH